MAFVMNPSIVQFSVSPDHDADVGGVAVLDGYRLVIRDVAASVVATTVDLGKPSPDAARQIAVPLPEVPKRLTLVAVVTAYGPGGVSPEAVSGDFALIDAPAPPLTVVVR